jgi:hypothetical protein
VAGSQTFAEEILGKQLELLGLVRNNRFDV